MLGKITKLLEDFEKVEFKFDIIEKKSDEIVQALKTKKLAIYPAGTSGQLLQKTLVGTNLKVVTFFDKAFDNLRVVNDIPVKNPSDLKDLGSDYFIIISANLDTQYDFFERTVKELNPQANIINGKNLNRLLKSPKCLTKLRDSKEFDLIECENCGFERKHCSIVSSYLKKVGKHKEIENDFRSIKFDWFGYIVSQTCTLKCEHCCEHVPYLRNQGFNSVETIISDVKKIAESSKFLNFVELIGGEPFLHPEIERLISELLEIENIGYIKSFTNGTIIPSDKLCKIMKNPRFMLQVSNYELTAKGKLLKNIFKTKQKLDDAKVSYLFTHNFEWLDFTSFKEHEASEKYLKKAFDNCFLKNCHRVYQGKLYRCPHHYAGVQRGQLKEYSTECIDIHSLGTIDLGKALEDFENLELLDACKHCDLAFNAKPVPAGKQLN